MSEEVTEWLDRINKAHPDFDVTKWTPLTTRFPELTVKELWKKVNENANTDN